MKNGEHQWLSGKYRLNPHLLLVVNIKTECTAFPCKPYSHKNIFHRNVSVYYVEKIVPKFESRYK